VYGAGSAEAAGCVVHPGVHQHRIEIKQGDVHEAILSLNGVDSAVVAIKKTRIPSDAHPSYTMLRHECRILVMLRGHVAIPDCLGYGKSDDYEFMALPLLGSDLLALLDATPNYRLDMRTGLCMIVQMVRLRS
jgi:hypothetical protein